MSEPSPSDILWNYLAFVVGGVSGILLFLLVGAWYGPQTLGVFNKVFAMYMVLSQVAAFGVHLSLLKHLAEAPPLPSAQSAVLRGGLCALVPSALSVPLLLALAATPVGLLLRSQETGTGLLFVAAGLTFFALNKVLLAAQNALSRFRLYAVGNCLRYVFLLLALLGHFLLGFAPHSLPVIFPLAEGVLSLVLIKDLLPLLMTSPHARGASESPHNSVRSWAREHFQFGFRAVGGNIMLDLNTRVDVLCLAAFTDDATLGIYSMAAILAEAAYQLPLVLQVVYTPKVVHMLQHKQKEELRDFIRNVRRLVWVGMGIAAILSTLLYPTIIPLLTGRPEYANGANWFGIIMIGLVLASGNTPFALILSNAGFPGRQSQMVLSLLLLKITGNLLLIPLFGPMGAAVSASLVHGVSLLLLRFFARKYIDIVI